MREEWLKVWKNIFAPCDGSEQRAAMSEQQAMSEQLSAVSKRAAGSAQSAC